MGFVDHGEYFICKIGGEVERCVSCRRPIEYVKRSDGEPGLANHHCQPSHENRRQAASRAERSTARRAPTYGERLSLGSMLASNEDAE